MEFGDVSEASGTWKERRAPATKTLAATVAPSRRRQRVQASKVSIKRQELERKARPRASRRRDSIILN